MLLKLPTGKSLEGWDKGSPGQELVRAWQDVFPVSVLDSNTTIPWSLVDNCLKRSLYLQNTEIYTLLTMKNYFTASLEFNRSFLFLLHYIYHLHNFIHVLYIFQRTMSILRWNL